jgi:hypothetical protein
MRPAPWQPPQDLSAAEQAIVRRIKRAKLFPFLRRIRHELFDAAFQAELATIYQESAEGHPPIPPAKLALATLLQAYTGASDDEAIEALTMDRRWQLVVDCLDCERAPFGKGTLVRFRAALIEHGLDRRLIERTVALAERDRDVGPRQLRAALDSSPLWGAGRVEDTYNLLGHALRKAVGVLAAQQGRELAAMARETGAALVAGSSLKAALDLDWDDPAQRATALAVVLEAVETFARRVDEGVAVGTDDPGVQASLAVARQVQAQDVVVGDDGTPALRQGVAADRRISVEDTQMRHGRKSHSQLVDGYKRHVLTDLDRKLVRAVGVTPANVPEAAVTEEIVADLRFQDVVLSELHIDRAYLASTLVRERPADLQISCRAWPVRTRGDLLPKTAFILDCEQATITCPHGLTIPFTLGDTVQFPAERCARCPLRARCTTSPRGRSIRIHPDEALLQELRARQLTPAGRAKLRERILVEHTLSHVGHWQGRRARYRGLRKNLFDLRRTAAVHNLHVLMHVPAYADKEAA